VRARAQSLGFACEGGLLARPERVLLTVLGLVLAPFNPSGLLIVVIILAVFTNLTALQRMVIVWRQSRAQLQPPLESATATPPPAPTVEVLRQEPREVRPGPEPAGG
jgi:hypothetical protein